MIAVPREAVRRVVRDRRQRAHEATAAMLASLTPERTAGAWIDIGSLSERAAGKLARRRTTKPRRAAR